MTSLDCFGLKDKVVLVSGGNRGIGKAIVTLLVEAGAKVAFTYTGSTEQSQAAAIEIANTLNQKHGEDSCAAFKLDVSDEAQCKEVLDQVIKKYSSLYGLVNNAGIAIDQLLLRYKSDDWQKLFDVNLKGLFQLTKLSLRHLMRSKEGSSVVNLSSVVAFTGNAGQAPYCASKAGIVGFTKSLSLEMAAKKVRANCIAPGFIATDMTHNLDEVQQNKLKEKIPLGEVGEAQDIAWGALYLLSPVSRYLTGQVLHINGGLY